MMLILLAAALAAQSGTFYDLKTQTLVGSKPADLGAYRGKVTLVVNVASYCGYTPQYKGLEALHRELQPKGFAVLGFPSNDFGEQEPGTAQEIADFCRLTYDVTFPMFAKVVTRPGPAQSPIYQFLGRTGNLPAWNFGKYLSARTARSLRSFRATSHRNPRQLRTAISKALATPDSRYTWAIPAYSVAAGRRPCAGHACSGNTRRRSSYAEIRRHRRSRFGAPGRRRCGAGPGRWSTGMGVCHSARAARRAGGRAAAPAAPVDTSLKQLPGSTLSFTLPQIRNMFGPADWFPGDHPTMPEVVAKGRQPDVRACALCHCPTAKGVQENAGVAGLPVSYFIQTMNDFKHDLRKSAEPRKGNTNLMIAIAKGMTDQEIARRPSISAR